MSSGRIFLWALLLLAPLAAQVPSRPNLVLILADDLGYGDLACYGHPYHRTPNLDRLAAEGLRCTRGYAPAPNCAPTRAALMTGRYAPATGIYTVGTSKRGSASDRRLIPIPNRTVLEERWVTLAESLRAAGYVTGLFGKWHLGSDPRIQGFDEALAGGIQGHPKSYFSPYHLPALEDGPRGEYLTDRLGEEAAAFITRHAAEPFFLYLPFYAVHSPHQARPDLIARYSDRPVGAARYAAMVSALDEAVGRVLKALDAAGLSEKTLVVFLSDNGPYQPPGAPDLQSAGPLRGGKGELYEGGIREPWIVRWPSRVPAGGECAVPQIALDLYPTFCSAAGIGGEELPPLDGVDLLPLWCGGEAPERDGLFFHFPVYLESYSRADRRQGRWRETPSGALVTSRWKLIERFESGAFELYDLEADPGEGGECSARYPKVRARLAERLARWREAVGAPVPTEPNPLYRSRGDFEPEAGSDSGGGR